MIKRKHFHELPHYLPLIGIYISGVIGFIIFSYDRQFQAGVAIAMAAAHVAWGVMHHYLHKDISLSIILEYVLMAFFGLVVLLSLIFRA